MRAVKADDAAKQGKLLRVNSTGGGVRESRVGSEVKVGVGLCRRSASSCLAAKQVVTGIIDGH